MRDKGYDFIRFFATILIIIWHFYTTCRAYGIPFPAWIKVIIDYCSIHIGGIGVALFFMLSGAVLWKQYKDNINNALFYKKKNFTNFSSTPDWLSYCFEYILYSRY